MEEERRKEKKKRIKIRKIGNGEINSATISKFGKILNHYEVRDHSWMNRWMDR